MVSLPHTLWEAETPLYQRYSHPHDPTAPAASSGARRHRLAHTTSPATLPERHPNQHAIHITPRPTPHCQTRPKNRPSRCPHWQAEMDQHPPRQRTKQPTTRSRRSSPPCGPRFESTLLTGVPSCQRQHAVQNPGPGNLRRAPPGGPRVVCAASHRQSDRFAARGRSCGVRVRTDPRTLGQLATRQEPRHPHARNEVGCSCSGRFQRVYGHLPEQVSRPSGVAARGPAR